MGTSCARRVVQAMPRGSEPPTDEIPVLPISPQRNEFLCTSLGEPFAEQVILPGTGNSATHNSKGPCMQVINIGFAITASSYRWLQGVCVCVCVRVCVRARAHTQQYIW